MVGHRWHDLDTVTLGSPAFLGSGPLAFRPQVTLGLALSFACDRHPARQRRQSGNSLQIIWSGIVLGWRIIFPWSHLDQRREAAMTKPDAAVSIGSVTFGVAARLGSRCVAFRPVPRVVLRIPEVSDEILRPIQSKIRRGQLWVGKSDFASPDSGQGAPRSAPPAPLTTGHAARRVQRCFRVENHSRSSAADGDTGLPRAT